MNRTEMRSGKRITEKEKMGEREREYIGKRLNWGVECGGDAHVGKRTPLRGRVKLSGNSGLWGYGYNFPLSLSV